MLSLYLCVSALLLESVELQRNVTEKDLSNFSTTSTPTTAGRETYATKPNNNSFQVYKDETVEFEGELGSNRSHGIITEDDERFQEADLPHLFQNKRCDRKELESLCLTVCVDTFHQRMQNISLRNWCALEHVIGPYNDLTSCMEVASEWTGCFFPNPDIQDIFVSVHSNYFQNCTDEQPEDAPHSVVIALTALPITLIPALVYLMVR